MKMWILNKYSITILVFAIWISFFDQNNLLFQQQNKKILKELEEERDYYTTEIASNEQKLNLLLTNSDNLEKFARETYLMKKDDEEIFVILQDTATEIAKKNTFSEAFANFLK